MGGLECVITGLMDEFRVFLNRWGITREIFTGIIVSASFVVALCCVTPVRNLKKNNSKVHSLIRGVLMQSWSAGAKNFTNYVFCHPQFSGVIQNIENYRAILTLIVYANYY